MTPARAQELQASLQSFIGEFRELLARYDATWPTLKELDPGYAASILIEALELSAETRTLGLGGIPLDVQATRFEAGVTRFRGLIGKIAERVDQIQRGKN